MLWCPLGLLSLGIWSYHNQRLIILFPLVSETPVVYQQLLEVFGEPFVWYEEPIVIEPEKTHV